MADTLKTTEGYRVILGDLLGEGATAKVYNAKLKNKEGDFALKMARSGQAQFIQDEFEIIDRSRQFYREKGKAQPTPNHFGQDASESREFFVMEFLHAKPVLEILEKREAFSEKQVVSLAVELFEFLDFLHRGHKLTYPDLKFDDIRLEEVVNEEDEPSYRLRILDLGGLSSVADISDRRCKQDVLVAASYLFTMLTGYTFQLLGGEVTDDIDKAVKSEAFRASVSWGVRRYFSKLLSRAAEFRIYSARVAADQAKELLSLWDLDEGALFKQTKGFSDQADKSKDDLESYNGYLTKARRGFDVFVRRFGEANPGSEILLEQAEKYYQGTSYLETGKVDLQHGEYDSAIRKFREGEKLENNPALFRRWRYLADALKTADDLALFSLTEQIAKAFEEENYQMVLDKAQGFPAQVDVDPIKVEAQVHQMYKDGYKHKDIEEYEKAIDTFNEISNLLSSLPVEDQKTIKKVENNGDPKALVDECMFLKDHAEVYDRYQELYKELEEKFQMGDFPIDDTHKFVKLGKHFPDVQKNAENLLKLAFKHGNLDQLDSVAGILFWGLPRKSETLHKQYRTSHDLAELQKAIDSYKYEDILRILKAFEAQYPESVLSLTGNSLSQLVDEAHPGAPVEFWKFLKNYFVDDEIRQSRINERIRAYQAQLSEDDAVLVEQLESLLRAFQLDKNKLIAFIHSYSSLDTKEFVTNTHKRFEKIEKLLKQAENFMDAKGIKKYRDELERNKKAFGMVDEELLKRDVSAQELKARWIEIDRGYYLKLDGTEPVHEREFFAILEDCLDILDKDLSDADRQITQTIMQEGVSRINALKLRGWTALKERQHVGQEELDFIKTRFEQGNLDWAWEAMNTLPNHAQIILGNENAATLYVRMLKTERFRQWHKMQENVILSAHTSLDISRMLMQELNEFDDSIPLKYYQLAKITDFLNRQNGQDPRVIRLKNKLGLIRPTQLKEKRTFNWKWITVSVPVIIIFCFSLVLTSGLSFAIGRGISATPARVEKAEAEQISTPTGTVSEEPVDEPTKVSAEPTLAEAVVPTPPPPTPVPDSDYRVENFPEYIKEVDPYARLPLSPLPISLPNSSEEVLGVWDFPDFSICEDDERFYCAEMDAPVEAGTYALFVYNRPKDFSSPRPALRFDVFSENSNEKLDIELGMGSVQFSTTSELANTGGLPNAWIWVGNYQFASPEKIKIKIGPGIESVAPKYFNRTLLIRVDENTFSKLPELSGYKLVSILDETSLNYKKYDQIPFPEEEEKPASEKLWNNNMLFVKEGRFYSAGVLPPGTYRTFFKVLDNNHAQITLKIGQGRNGDLHDPILDQDVFEIPDKAQWLELTGKIKDGTSSGEVKIEDASVLTFYFYGRDLPNSEGFYPVPVDAILIYKKVE